MKKPMVRTAYAKFAYAVQQGAIGKLALERNPGGGRPVPEEYAGKTGDQRLADAQVNFNLEGLRHWQRERYPQPKGC